MTFLEKCQIRKLIKMMEEDKKKQEKEEIILIVVFVLMTAVGFFVALKVLLDLGVMG